MVSEGLRLTWSPPQRSHLSASLTMEASPQKRGESARTIKGEKDKIINVPMPSTVIYEDDVLMVVGSDVDLARLPQE